MHANENNGSRLPLRIALIGAGGFLGTNLAIHLGSRVTEVRCFGRRQAFPEALQGFRWITGDTSLDMAGALGEAIAGCDAVIHLASTSTPTTADRDISADAQTNVIASLRLFDQCVAAGIKRLVFMSSGGTVYGIPSHVPIPESAPTLPITAYGVAKLAIEKYLEVYSRLRGLDYRVLRISNLYGPFQTAEKKQGVVAAFLSEAMRGKPLEIWGDGLVVRDYVYVADVAEAVLAALQHQGEHRIFNIGSGTGLNLIEVIDAMEHLLGRRLQRQFRPGRPVDVPVNILDCMLAKMELGWQPRTGFADGLRLAAQWLENWHRQQRSQVG
jgi:UDP-glucose 4-epimerase